MKFAIVSTDIRRDLILPMRHFKRLQISHYYKNIPYNDLETDELDQSLIRYRSPFDLKHLLEKGKSDIIQTVELLSIRQWLYHNIIYNYASHNHKPMIAGVHISKPLMIKYGRIPALLLKYSLQPSIKHIKLFFYLNEGAKRNLLWLGVPEEKLVKHMYGTWGVDLDEFTPIRNGKEPNWGDMPILLYVGRIHPEKGVFDLIDAFDIIHKSQQNTRLIFIGDGPLLSEARSYVAMRNWREKVAFLGTVRNRELPPYFRAATLFISPSVTTKKWEEYVGVTNLQAMACGLPIISTRCGSIPEYIPDSAGILVPERKPSAIAEAILKIVNSIEIQRDMGKAGRDYVINHCDARKNVQEAENTIYRFCIPGRQ